MTSTLSGSPRDHLNCDTTPGTSARAACEQQQQRQQRQLRRQSSTGTSTRSSVCSRRTLVKYSNAIDTEDVRFATVDQLIHSTVVTFDDEGVAAEADESVAYNVFLMHHWYVGSAELVTRLHDYYTHATCVAHSGGQRSGERAASVPECCACRYARAQLCRAVHFWMHNFARHFDANVQLRERVQALQQDVLHRDGQALADLLDVNALLVEPSYAWLRNVSIRNHMVRQQSLSFDQWTPAEIANCLTHIEYRALARITFSEYKQYAQSNNVRTTPILERSITLFNSLCHWVQCMVLNKASPKERADVMIKFINVSTVLCKLHNFNTLMAVVGGLTHSSLARLTKTYARIPPALKHELSSLADLLSHVNNFAAYRHALAHARGMVIPIIGVHLKDLIAVNAAHADFGDSPQLVNCAKLRQLATVFQHILLPIDQASQLPEGNLDLINTLKVSLDIRYKEDEIYELSLKREPRTLLNFQSARGKSDVFADWAAGVSAAPDQQQVNKHVTQMVDAVFKHYDNDKDDYISQAEFDAIAGNFPFIDSFCTLDTDRPNVSDSTEFPRDGKISRNEMVDYFLKVNQKNATELRRGFRHNFHETTFLAPTICVHCNKLLWGLLRQGFKCKDCAIAVHRGCKDFAVAECRRRSRHNDDAPWSPRSDADNAGSADVPNGPSSSTADGSPSKSSLKDDATDKSTSHRRRLFLNISMRHKNRSRLVSTTTGGTADSHTPSPSPTPPATAEHPMKHRWFSIRKARARSETNDRSPEYPEVEVLPTLASEEVFEEEPSQTSAHSK